MKSNKSIPTPLGLTLPTCFGPVFLRRYVTCMQLEWDGRKGCSIRSVCLISSYVPRDSELLQADTCRYTPLVKRSCNVPSKFTSSQPVTLTCTTNPLPNWADSAKNNSHLSPATAITRPECYTETGIVSACFCHIWHALASSTKDHIQAD